MASSGYLFTWKHGKSVVQIPVKIKKTVDNNYGIGGKLVCPDCATSKKKNKVVPVKQQYTCSECSFTGTIGQIPTRYDADEDVIYNDKEKRAFMEQQIEKVVKVVKELPLHEVLLNLEFLDGFQEIYSNENNVAIATMVKTHSWMMKHKVAMLVQYGQRGKNRSGLIIPTKDRLLLVELRDYRLIRTPLQQGIEQIKSDATETLNANTESTEPQLYASFIDAVKKGKKLTVEKKVEEKPIIVEVPDFLED